MDRRQFFRSAAAASGAIYLGSRLPVGAGTEPNLPGTSILSGAPADSGIDHIVVLMMENRSVDHYLGWLAEDPHYLEQGRRRYGRGFGFDGALRQSFADPEGNVVSTYHLPSAKDESNPYRGCGHPDPGHGWNSGRAQRDHGFLHADSGNDAYAVGYYLSEDLPIYSAAVRRFTTFDRYYCSLLTSTFPNREYLHSAQSGGIKNNDLPPEAGYPTGFDWDTIWDRLRDRGGMAPRLDAAYYFVDLPAIALWGPRMVPFAGHIEEYFARAASGTLPSVTFLDPGFTTGLRTDDHPYADIRAGQKLVTDFVKAFVESPQWQSGAMFITYDEWGGFFDHVPPLRLADDRAGTVPGGEDDFAQAGFRVPTLLLSPQAPPGFVDGGVYDHTSILRFIEWRFLGAPPAGTSPSGGEPWWLTSRDRHAANIGMSLRTKETHFDPEFNVPDVPEVPVTSAPCPGHEAEGLGLSPGGGEPRSDPELEQHAFEKALHAGLFERMGFDIELKPIPSL